MAKVLEPFILHVPDYGVAVGNLDEDFTGPDWLVAQFVQDKLLEEPKGKKAKGGEDPAPAPEAPAAPQEGAPA